MDRNFSVPPGLSSKPGSLSARRAWIEIRTVKAGTIARVVALRKESVDRNSVESGEMVKQFGRSPQGERG